MIKGIVFSQFNEKTGPEAVAWLPEIPIEKRSIISMKSINVLSGEKGQVPESLSMIPLPSQNQKALIKTIEIKDKTHRGGVIDSSLTLLFDEAHDLIFYKYIDKFQGIFNESADRIKNLHEAKALHQKIEKELEVFREDIIEALIDLNSSEVQEEEAFPTKKAEPLKDLRTFRFKIIVCGDPEVGKTSLVLRFTDSAFRRTYIPTLGVNISEKIIKYEKYAAEFVIWDVAGQSKFQLMRKHFYGGANGLLLIFDLTRPNTFQSLVRWYADIKATLGVELEGLIVGNKNDLTEERKIGRDKITELSNELGLEALETSALTGENVDEAFRKLGELLINLKIQET